MPRRRGLNQEQLLKAAIRVIRQHGYRDTSLQDIADEFHFTKPALYYYIQNKEELLYKIYDESISAWIARLESLAEDRNLSAREKLQQVLAYYLDLCINHDEMVIFFNEKSNLSAEHYELISAKERRVMQIISGIYREGVEEGTFRPWDATAVTFAILGMGAWTSHWFSHDGPLSQQELVNLYDRLLAEGYAEGPVAPNAPDKGPAKTATQPPR
jgi:AcrR family transcriptional regulator